MKQYNSAMKAEQWMYSYLLWAKPRFYSWRKRLWRISPFLMYFFGKWRPLFNKLPLSNTFFSSYRNTKFGTSCGLYIGHRTYVHQINSCASVAWVTPFLFVSAFTSLVSFWRINFCALLPLPTFLSWKLFLYVVLRAISSLL